MARKGDTHGTLAERLWRRIDKNGPIPENRPDLGPCWVWTGYIQKIGYAMIREGGKKDKMLLVHRVAYELVKGKIPNDMELDHLCKNPNCSNPDHLEAVTHLENTSRSDNFIAINAKKTHCIRGHPLSGSNLREYRGKRCCRECHHMHTYRYRAEGRYKGN